MNTASPHLNADDIRQRLAADLACPSCRGALRLDPQVACCACGRVFPQSDPRVLDLWMRDVWDEERARWGDRQREMEGAYRELAADPDHVRRAYIHDFGPFRTLLEGVRGRTLDLGGGNGLLRDFLPPRLEYVSLDPSLDWLDAAWSAVADTFPSMASLACFVRGIGEQLPFHDATFDCVVSFWSLNHVADPARVIRESRRILRPGGRFFLVLDDIAPRWSDLTGAQYRDPRFPTRGALVRQKLVSLVRGWPLQPDHLAISERMLSKWLRGLFRLRARRWVGCYLAIDLAAE